jgi:hypothetical protein
MNPYTYEVSLRVTHPSKNLGDVFQSLSSIPGVVPGRLVNKGGKRTTPQGQELGGKYNKSGFHIKLSEDKQSSEKIDLEDSLLNFVEKIKPYQEPLNDLVVTGGMVSFFVGLFIDANSGLVFDNTFLKELSNMGIGLELDIYPSDIKVE